jgi:fatty acid desaturase
MTDLTVGGDLDAVTRPRTSRVRDNASDYSDLLQLVRGAGLLERRRGFYLTLFTGLVLALVGVAAGVATLGDTWSQLLLAAALGLVLAQLGFLAHEAAHREIFRSGPANDRAGRVVGDLLVGISYSWWKDGHNRHHANPNLVGKDPSVDRGAFSFTEEDAMQATGLAAWYTKRQGYFFFPLLLLAGVNLHVEGFRTVFGRGKVEHRWTEIALLAVRHASYLTGLFLLLPAGKAAAFLGVQLAVFGVALASSFVPNHVGMPILPRGAKVDFLRRQVLTSRNITGGWPLTAWMGGLNYQIEHHLFPSMPRPNLSRARKLTLEYCRERDISYTETSLPQAYGIIVRHLNQVGLAAARNSFHCPAASSLGR